MDHTGQVTDDGPERQNLETQVLERAAKDPQFREQLKQDPRGSVARELGVQVPQDITVEVVEETPTRVYLVLPPVPAQPGQALSDQELEAVAGGEWSALAGPQGGPRSCEGGCTVGCLTLDVGAPECPA